MLNYVHCEIELVGGMRFYFMSGFVTENSKLVKNVRTIFCQNPLRHKTVYFFLQVVPICISLLGRCFN